MVVAVLGPALLAVKVKITLRYIGSVVDGFIQHWLGNGYGV
jgi:hypothetical protein